MRKLVAAVLVSVISLSSATSFKNQDIISYSSGAIQPMTTGYWTDWKMRYCDWRFFYQNYEIGYFSSYYQLNPSTGEYILTNTRKKVVIASSCPDPYSDY